MQGTCDIQKSLIFSNTFSKSIQGDIVRQGPGYLGVRVPTGQENSCVRADVPPPPVPPFGNLGAHFLLFWPVGAQLLFFLLCANRRVPESDVSVALITYVCGHTVVNLVRLH